MKHRTIITGVDVCVVIVFFFLSYDVYSVVWGVTKGIMDLGIIAMAEERVERDKLVALRHCDLDWKVE